MHTDPTPPPPESPPPAIPLFDGGWQRAVAQPALILLLTLSLLMGPIALMRQISGEQRFLILLPFFLFVILQAIYTRRWLARPEHRWFGDPCARLGEIALVLLLLRLVVWAIQRQPLTLEVARGWLLDPLTFFDPLYVLNAGLALIAWGFAASLTTLFLDLGLAPDELIPWEDRLGTRAWVQAQPKNRQEMLERYAEQWMWGGVLLTLSAALARVQFRPAPGRLFGLSALGLGPELVLALVFYFLIGLFLLSYGQLAVLRSRWQREGTPGIGQVTGRWQRRALITILGVGVLASLLPLGSSFGLALILNAVIQALLLAVSLLVGLVAALVMWLSGLFGVEMTAPPEPPPPLPQIDLLPPAPPPTEPVLPPWAPGGLFWLLLSLLLLYLLYHFLTQQEMGRALLRRGWFTRLRAWWRLLWARAGAAAERARARLAAASLPGAPASLPQPWRFVRLLGLSPTARARYFYLSTLRRAAQAGAARAPAQTPLEYEATLAQHLPAASAEIDALTASFLRARYAPAPLDEPAAHRAQSAAARIKHYLRRLRRAADAADQREA